MRCRECGVAHFDKATIRRKFRDETPGVGEVCGQGEAQLGDIHRRRARREDVDREQGVHRGSIGVPDAEAAGEITTGGPENGHRRPGGFQGLEPSTRDERQRLGKRGGCPARGEAACGIELGDGRRHRSHVVIERCRVGESCQGGLGHRQLVSQVGQRRSIPRCQLRSLFVHRSWQEVGAGTCGGNHHAGNHRGHQPRPPPPSLDGALLHSSVAEGYEPTVVSRFVGQPTIHRRSAGADRRGVVRHRRRHQAFQCGVAIGRLRGRFDDTYQLEEPAPVVPGERVPCGVLGHGRKIPACSPKSVSR